MKTRVLRLIAVAAILLMATCAIAANPPQSAAKKPRVIVIGVNGAEWDLLRPLLVKGDLPNLSWVIRHGVSGKLRTASAPNCPKIYSIFETGAPPTENGITGFKVGGVVARTDMLRLPTLWQLLSNRGISVGMANVPATFPARPLRGYMISGMLTPGKDCDGMLCSPKLSEVSGAAVYPPALAAEIEARVGDVPIDCSRMPDHAQLHGHEADTVHSWLAGVSRIRRQQEQLFDYLLSNHPTDFTFLVQSCEDRTGHWLYPIQPFNVGYNPKVHTLSVNAFPDQYRAFDKVLATILKHVDTNTTLLIISDHGIKPLRYDESEMARMDHGGDAPIIAKHDFEDGDEVPGIFIAMGPGIKKGTQIFGLQMSVFDIAPTILHVYGLAAPQQMKGRVLDEIFDSGLSAPRQAHPVHARHNAAPGSK